MKNRMKPVLFLLFVFFSCSLFSVASTQVRITCPRKCTCSKNFRRISCSYQKLTEIPANIPTTATELFLSHNYLTKIPTSAFLNLTNLTQLALNNNQLQTLEKGAFNGLQNLKELFLSTNKLSGLNPSIFQSLAKLEHLYLSSNLLTEIPDLSSVISLRILGLDTNNLETATFSPGFSNLTLLSTITLTNNRRITHIYSTDFRSLNRMSIRAINVGRCSITTVEAGVFNFTHLQSLTLSYNPLSIPAIGNISSTGFSELTSLHLDQVINGTIPADLFRNLSSAPLKNLFLTNSRLSGPILNGTFDHFPRLEALDLTNCGISLVQDGVFSPKLGNLTKLLLKLNKLSDIPKMDLPSLQILNLQQNLYIVGLKKSSFPSLSKLDQLLLSSCAITRVEANSFVGLSSLTVLDLSHNGIGGNSLPVGSFNVLGGLQTLNLSNNKMTTIATESNLFANLGLLKKLDMSNNQCVNMSLKLFQPVQQLVELDLSTNQLGSVIASDVNGQLFEGLDQLRRLHIRSNALSSLPQLLFKNLTALEMLDVSQNLLSSWPEDFVPPSSSDVVVIDFTGNKITTVSQLEFSPFAEQVHLNLTNNPLACGCDMMWFRRWISANNQSATLRLENLTNYICSSPQSMAHKKLLDFNPDDIEKSCYPPPWRWILVGVGSGIFAVMLFAFLLGYRYRWPLRLKWYHLRLRMCNKSHISDGFEPMNEAEYDIMISYGPSTRDSDWVKDVLVPKIGLAEAGPVQAHVEEDELRINSLQSTEEDGEQPSFNDQQKLLVADELENKKQVNGDQANQGTADEPAVIRHAPTHEQSNRPSANASALDQQRWNLFFEENNIDFNKPVIAALADAIERSHKVLIVLSKDYLKDSRRKYEVQLAVAEYCSSLDRIILVSLDPDADLRMPPMLHPIARMDRVFTWSWNEADAESFWTHLREEIRRPVVPSDGPV